jgi:ABC-type antimicrobial peptide transport system permease subunit
MVLRQAVGVTGIGVILGLAVALVAGRLLEDLLFSTSPRDPVVLGGVVAILMVVALAAAAVPAWAAAKVDPMGALRTE